MSRILYLALAILVGIGGLVFHVRNNQDVALDYFLGSVTVDLSWLVVAAVAFGALLGVLAMGSSMLRLRRELHRQNRRNEKASRELSSLRAVALKDAG